MFANKMKNLCLCRGGGKKDKKHQKCTINNYYRSKYRI